MSVALAMISWMFVVISAVAYAKSPNWKSYACSLGTAACFGFTLRGML